MQSNPIDHMQEALQLLQRHGSHDLAEWFSGLDWTRATAGQITDYRARKIRRDALLTCALAKIPGGTTWTGCSELAAAIRRFETRTWPRCRFKANPPDRFSELESLLFDVYKLSVTVPSSVQGLMNATQICCTRNLANVDVE